MTAPLIVAQDLADYLGLVIGNENANRLNFIVTFSSSWLLEKVGRDFSNTSRTEKYVGNGTKFLVLQNFPVTALTSVTVQDGTLTTTIDITDVLQVDLWDPAQGILTRTNGDVWPEQQYRNITVVYTGGPSGPPQYLVGAALELAAYLYQTSGGRTSFTSPDASVQFQQLAQKGLLQLPAVAAAISQAQDIVYSTDT